VAYLDVLGQQDQRQSRVVLPQLGCELRAIVIVTWRHSNIEDHQVGTLRGNRLPR